MQINISRALKLPGTPLDFSIKYPADGLMLNGGNFKFLSDLDVMGTCMYTGENFIVKGAIKVEYRSQCDRCTRPVSGKMDILFEEEFASYEDENHPDRYLYKGDDIVIDKMVEDNIYLNAPIQYLCTKFCKGLCPQCGKDLNQGDCGCKAEDVEQEVNNPFAVLKDILRDDEEEV